MYCMKVIFFLHRRNSPQPCDVSSLPYFGNHRFLPLHESAQNSPCSLYLDVDDYIDNNAPIPDTHPYMEAIRYEPVAASWQKSRAKALGLDLEKIQRYLRPARPYFISVLEPPRTVARIRGDGNCFFRCLSHILTGSQAYHKYLRQAVTSYTLQHNQFFSEFSGSQHADGYFYGSRMSQMGTWATEIEIIATASMLATDICVYSPCSRDRAGNAIYKWLIYRAQSTLAPLGRLRKVRVKMYISNEHHHYEPVYEL